MTWCGKKQTLYWIVLLFTLAASTVVHGQSRFVTTRGELAVLNLNM